MYRPQIASVKNCMRTTAFARFGCHLACLFLFPIFARAENPHWIWHNNKGAAIQTNEVRYFRRTFTLASRPAKALLSVAADDEAVVYLNGKEVANPKDYAKPVCEEVTSELKKGQNVLAIRGHNIASNVAGVLGLLELRFDKKKTDF